MLLDKLFRKNRIVALGKLRYKDSAGDAVTITKDIRYTIKCGSSVIHMYDMDDVKGYCKERNYTPMP